MSLISNNENIPPLNLLSFKLRDLVLSSGHHVVVGFIIRKVGGGGCRPEYEGLVVEGPAYRKSV